MNQDELREWRREYQRRYYESHKDKAKEYQRQYNATHQASKKRRHTSTSKGKNVGKVYIPKEGYHASDIMHAPADKAARILNKILRGEEVFVR
jgi:NAD+--asparagine ADP-ribosyltransferase